MSTMIVVVEGIISPEQMKEIAVNTHCEWDARYPNELEMASWRPFDSVLKGIFAVRPHVDVHVYHDTGVELYKRTRVPLTRLNYTSFTIVDSAGKRAI